MVSDASIRSQVETNTAAADYEKTNNLIWTVDQGQDHETNERAIIETIQVVASEALWGAAFRHAENTLRTVSRVEIYTKLTIVPDWTTWCLSVASVPRAYTAYNTLDEYGLEDDAQASTWACRAS